MLKLRELKKIGKRVGPGVVTGASDDDPSGILTYLQSGAVLGFKTLWAALFTLPLMFGIQEMCGRIGLVTGKGLMQLIKENYSRKVLFVIAFISVLVITINIGADLLAIAVVMEKLAGISRLFWLPFTALLILIATIFLSYRKFAGILKWLVLSLFFYIITTIYIGIDWGSALRHTLIPNFSWTKDSIILISAILGTTISPYLFFWQTSEEVEDEEETVRERSLKRFEVTKGKLRVLAEDTFAGMLLSNVVTWFIIAGASQLAIQGMGQIQNFDQAALVLQPLLGDLAYLIFSLGIIGTGLLAIPVLAGTVGYGIAEILSMREGINLKFRDAKGFYIAITGATIAGMLLTFLKLDPVKLLVYTAVLYTLITPPLIWIIIRLGNNGRIMKHRTNSKLSNVLGYATFALMALAAISSLFFIF